MRWFAGVALLCVLAAGCGTPGATSPLPTRTPRPTATSTPSPSPTANPAADRAYLAAIAAIERRVGDAVTKGTDAASAFASNGDGAQAAQEFDDARVMYEEAASKLDALLPPPAYSAAQAIMARALDRYLAANTHFHNWVAGNSDPDFNQAATLQRQATALFKQAEAGIPTA